MIKINAVFLSLFFSAVVLFGLETQAQISFAEFERQVKADLDDLPSSDSITAVSDCGSVNMEIDEKIFSGGCAGTLVRTYTATDDCGNTANTSQFISLIDKRAPVFVGIKEVVFAGVDGSNASTDILVEDNSGQKINPTFTDVKSHDIILRTWVAEDNCGNRSTFIQRLLLKEEF